jgi:hypothetical protein
VNLSASKAWLSETVVKWLLNLRERDQELAGAEMGQVTLGHLNSSSLSANGLPWHLGFWGIYRTDASHS